MPVLPAVGDELIALNNMAGGMPQRNGDAWPLGTALNELAAGSGGIPAPGGSAQGDILFFNGLIWTNLVPGVAGTFLQSNGPGATPTYVPVAASSSLVIEETYSCPGTVAVGDAVFLSAANTVDKASAESGAGQTAAAIGFVRIKPTGITATVVFAGPLNVFVGLTPNVRYWLSATTDGLITATPPSTVGQNFQPVGWAVSGTKLLVEIAESVLL